MQKLLPTTMMTTMMTTRSKITYCTKYSDTILNSCTDQKEIEGGCTATVVSYYEATKTYKAEGDCCDTYAENTNNVPVCTRGENYQSYCKKFFENGTCNGVEVTTDECVPYVSFSYDTAGKQPFNGSCCQKDCDVSDMVAGARLCLVSNTGECMVKENTTAYCKEYTEKGICKSISAIEVITGDTCTPYMTSFYDGTSVPKTGDCCFGVVCDSKCCKSACSGTDCDSAGEGETAIGLTGTASVKQFNYTQTKIAR